MVTTTDGIRCEVDDQIATITIDRPEARNALGTATWAQLGRTIDELSTADLRCLIITGAGETAFAAGTDVGSLTERTSLTALAGPVQAILGLLESLPFPTIAALNGHTLGGGCELALACDLRIATPNGKIGLPEVQLGIIPGAGGTWRLSRTVGIGIAKELILTGQPVTMAEAHRIGLVNRLVEPDQLLPSARELALTIADNGPLAVRTAKALLNAGPLGAQVGPAFENVTQAFLFSTDDHREGLDAFLEKRSSTYTGT